MKDKIEYTSTINEDLTKLSVLTVDEAKDTDYVLSALKENKVVLIQGVTQVYADNIIFDVAKKLGLAEKLETEAGFASVIGHRKSVGKYFMSVNERSDYQVIPAHSEGSHRMNMQLASFYAMENTTDGGETILFNTRETSSEWDSLRDIVTKCDIGNRKLTQLEIMQAKMLLNINIPEDIVTKKDVVVSEKGSPAPGITLFNVLVPLQKIRSIILERDCFVYWDTVASVDFDSGLAYLDFLKTTGLLKEPESGIDISRLDYVHPRRLWSSGMNYSGLFESKITRKLIAGDMIIMNNLTWTHATNNWTPGSGQRKVVAAFA
ncbi:MAG: hypothetical protein V4732_16585 [Pseudomonadota bacterium]